MEGSESVKIEFRQAQGCAFMMQTVRVGDKDYLIGSTIDCWLFLYDLSVAIPEKALAEIQLDPYPVATIHYHRASNNLVCGTAGGTILLFRNFSRTLLKDCVRFCVNG